MHPPLTGQWRLILKAQVLFTLVGTLVPLLALGGYALSSSGPDWEGAWWPLGLLGYALLSPGAFLCSAAGHACEPGSLAVFLTNGAFFFLLGTAFVYLEAAKRARKRT